MKTVIAKKDFYLGEVKTLQAGKEYKIVFETANGVVIRNDYGNKQGFNKESDWIEFR